MDALLQITKQRKIVFEQEKNFLELMTEYDVANRYKVKSKSFHLNKQKYFCFYPLGIYLQDRPMTVQYHKKKINEKNNYGHVEVCNN